MVIIIDKIEKRNNLFDIYCKDENGRKAVLNIFDWFLKNKGIDINTFEKVKKLSIKVKGGGKTPISALSQNFIDEIEVIEE